MGLWLSRWCVTKVSPTYHHIPIPSSIYPVNKFHQIHYPDKSMINCSVYIFSQIRKGIQTMGKVKNSSQIHTDSKQSFVTIKPQPPNTHPHHPRGHPAPPPFYKLLLSMSDHNKCKTVLIIHHISILTPSLHGGCPPPLPTSTGQFC